MSTPSLSPSKVLKRKDVFEQISQEELNAVKLKHGPELVTSYTKLYDHAPEVDLRSDSERATGRSPIKRRKSPVQEVAKQYQKELKEEWEKISQDEMYDERQKRVKMRIFTKEKETEYTMAVIDKINIFNDEAKSLKGQILKTINKAEKLSPVERKEIEFVSRELEAETKTALLTAFAPDKVLAVFNKMMDQAQYNEHQARFLYKHSYLFMERIQATAKDQREVSSQIQSIQTGMIELEKMIHTTDQLALKKMLKNTDKFYRSGTDGLRLIKQTAKKYA